MSKLVLREAYPVPRTPYVGSRISPVNSVSPMSAVRVRDTEYVVRLGKAEPSEASKS